MNKEFSISIQRPGNQGLATASHLMLPATWGELTDALDRARIYDDRQIFSVEVLKAKRDFLLNHIPGYVNLYELNYLAECLTSLKGEESSTFEALVRMNESKAESAPICMERLINMTYSVGNCHHVKEITNDRELGEFVLENGLREDLAELSEESIELLDRERLGREHREATGGVILKVGYFENSEGEISNLYQSENITMPEKPEYIFRLEIAETPYHNKDVSEKNLTIKLPTDPIVVETIMKTLHAPGWGCCTCRHFDSILPGLDEIQNALEELAQMNELASCIKSIDEAGQLPKYKALISSIENPELQTTLQLAKELDGFSFHADMAGPADYADYILNQHGIRPGDSLYPYIDRYSYGCSVMEKDHVKQTAYGFIRRTDAGPILPRESSSISTMTLSL